MNKEALVEVLLSKQGYLKSGSFKVAKVFKVTRAIAKEAIKEAYSIINNIGSKNNIKRLFFDIETSPNIMLSWRAGYKLNLGPENIIKERAIICICYKWEHEDKVHYLTWDNKQCDKTMLELFIDEMHKADEVIGHNGDKYDIPWIRTRCLYHRIPMMPDVKSLDTYKKVKGRLNLNSNKLDYLGKFLKVGEKQETGGFDLWKNICLNNDPEALKKMVEYCIQDVVLLEKVFKELTNYIKHNTHVGAIIDDNAASCPNCGGVHHRYIKKLVSPVGAISHQLQCTDCNGYYKLNKTNYKKLTDANL